MGWMCYNTEDGKAREGEGNLTQGRRDGKKGEDEKAGKPENEQVSPLVLYFGHISDCLELGFTIFMRFQTELYPHSQVECLGFSAGSVQPNLRTYQGSYSV